MARKLKIAIFDNDLRATIKKYPVSDSGDQIKIVSGGENHFMPRFDNESFIEFPIKLGPFRIGWEKIYFAKKRAKKCVNFKTEEVAGPSPEETKNAIGSTLLSEIGKGKLEIPQFLWILLFLNTGFLIIIMRVLGVF